MLDFRPYSPGDEHKIVELFETVFGRPMSLAFWRWRFQGHPLAEPAIALCFDDETLIGVYATTPAPLALSGELHHAALSVSSMTHPAWRGQQIFERTGRRLYDLLADAGVAAAYGFPNASAHPVRLKRVGWSDIGEVPTMTLDLAGLRSAVSADPAVVEAPTVDARFSRFLAEHQPTLPICGYRDEDILAWRLDRHPQNVYTKLVLAEGDGIAGYAVFKAFNASILDLVELRCTDAAAARVLVASVVSKAISGGYGTIATWCLPWEIHRLTLEDLGFKASAPVTYFGGRVIAPLPVDFFDLRRWRLSMLDSDLF